MRLSTWLQSIITLPAAIDGDVRALTLDSRRVQAGDVFIALKGQASDGRQFIADAIANGASAILLQTDEKDAFLDLQTIPLIYVPQLNKKIGELAAHFYDYPAKKCRLIGVTGTNGKTSCTHFIAQLLQAAGIPCGLIGTLGNGFYGKLVETGLTTPDVITLQQTLYDFVAAGAKAVVMEVSSHSIDQDRIHGLLFELGIFTNLTQDHLDYHGSMDAYAAVKKRFIEGAATKQVIINADDAHGAAWIAEIKNKKPLVAYTCHEPNTALGAPFVYASQVQFSLQGITAKIHTPWGEGSLQAPVIGEFNLSNLLAIIAALVTFGLSLDEVLAALKKMTPVPGRMQQIHVQHHPLCVVDYAHTPDALLNALQALRKHTKAKLICVFGCGGDRDKGKRPQMAAIAEKLADYVIVTSDNPRHEKPEAIAAAILQGFSHPEKVTVELDRAKAIEKSIQWAGVDDCILIAGKGAEHYQQIGDHKFPFDDVQKVMEIVNAALVK